MSVVFESVTHSQKTVRPLLPLARNPINDAN